MNPEFGTRDMFNDQPLRTDAYASIYDGLSELRESFHRSGRLDDSNAKLDEVAKLFATYVAFKLGRIDKFPTGDDSHLLEALQDAFRKAAELPMYQAIGGGSIFGANPAIILRAGDEALAMQVVNVVTNCIDKAYELRDVNQPFDLINEAFGHFIRENFRGNIEDAQYMTPPEVVEFIVSMVLRDIEIEDPKAASKDATWTVLDPTCGVGSFLTTTYQLSKAKDWIAKSKLMLIGQDKVERMVRLATINMALFDVGSHQVSIGNSLKRGSPIDSLNDSVDVILTNPPFGAKFDASYISHECGENTPFFSNLKRANGKLDSELLFIDRNLKLLREGGRLIIVVPDGVVSAKGTAAMLRSHLKGRAKVRAVIELPPVTFAQAGTRTRTAILYLEKVTSTHDYPVFMASANDLGFQVSSRKGVQVKIESGVNELPQVLKAYTNIPARFDDSAKIVMREPSCVFVPSSSVEGGSWTPNHYKAERFVAATKLAEHDDFVMVPLKSLVKFTSETRKTRRWSTGYGYISILHVLGEGFIDCGAAMAYSPKTPGVPVEAGEILFSRINPRIPRVAIAPDLGVPTLCSSEFVVMRPVEGWTSESIAYLLLSDIVQSQIRSLTSGTSASHNRIRVSELGEVLIPTPIPESDAAVRFENCVRKYRRVTEDMAKCATLLAEIRGEEASIFAA